MQNLSVRNGAKAGDTSIDADEDNETPTQVIRMSDLKIELDISSPPKKKQRADSSLQHSSPFTSIPDELVLKIMKFFANGSSLHTDEDATYSNVMNPVARVSTRFNRIAKDRSLWMGRVLFDFYKDRQRPVNWVGVTVHRVTLRSYNYGGIRFQDIIDYAVKFCLNDGVEILELIDGKNSSLSSTVLSQDQVTTIAGKCPNLKTLLLCHMSIESLPKSLADWKMVEYRSKGEGGDECTADIARIDKLGSRVRVGSGCLNRTVPVQPMPGYQLSGQKTYIFYTFPDHQIWDHGVPWITSVDDLSYPRPLTLKDVMERRPPKGQQYRFFFKTASEDCEVFVEVHADGAEVPMLGRINAGGRTREVRTECWIDIDTDMEMCLNYQKLTKNSNKS